MFFGNEEDVFLSFLLIQLFGNRFEIGRYLLDMFRFVGVCFVGYQLKDNLIGSFKKKRHLGRIAIEVVNCPANLLFFILIHTVVRIMGKESLVEFLRMFAGENGIFVVWIKGFDKVLFGYPV